MLAALALLHAGVLVLCFSFPPRLRWSAADGGFVTQVFFLPEASPLIEDEPVLPTRGAVTRRAERPLQTAPITPPPEAPSADVPTAPGAIDWAREAEVSAARQLRKDEEARRLTAPFAHDFSHLTPERPTPQFGWSHASIHRVEPLEGGGTFIWINDRCGIVFAVMVVPICKIGKIPARGDLFEHMDDAPAPGKEPPP